MKPTEKNLYKFMTSCGGNWRNTILIDSPGRPNDSILVAFDRDAHPVALKLGKLRELAGEQIDPEECRARIDENAARDIFGQYFIWHSASDEEGPLEV